MDDAMRQRVTQPKLDQMARLRRQGLTFQEIGERVGCSERTARRKVGHIAPQIQPPKNEQTLESTPEVLRERLATGYSALLQRHWDKWPSTRFVAEVNEQLSDRLGNMDTHTLRLVASDKRMKNNLFMEVWTPLVRDFVWFNQVQDAMASMGLDGEREEWRPARERPALEGLEADDEEAR